MLPNLLWTALFLGPAAVYCYCYLPHKSALLFSVISFGVLFLPNAVLDRLQLSYNRKWYEKLGIRYINLLAQNGALIKRALNKKHPDFRAISSRASLRKLYFQTYFFEKFHLALFVFLLLTTVQALVIQKFVWVIILVVANLLYNVYPNLLQQYIRVRLKQKPENIFPSP